MLETPFASTASCLTPNDSAGVSHRDLIRPLSVSEPLDCVNSLPTVSGRRTPVPCFELTLPGCIWSRAGSPTGANLS